MAVMRETPRGRDFTAEELIGRQIRIECPVEQATRVAADGETIGNASKVVLTIAQNNVAEAILTLCHVDQTVEEITLRDNIELSFSAIVSEVQ